MTRPYSPIAGLPDEASRNLAVTGKTETAEVAKDDLLGLLTRVLRAERQLMRLAVSSQRVGRPPGDVELRRGRIWGYR